MQWETATPVGLPECTRHKDCQQNSALLCQPLEQSLLHVPPMRSAEQGTLFWTIRHTIAFFNDNLFFIFIKIACVGQSRC